MILHQIVWHNRSYYDTRLGAVYSHNEALHIAPLLAREQYRLLFAQSIVVNSIWLNSYIGLENQCEDMMLCAVRRYEHPQDKQMSNVSPKH